MRLRRWGASRLEGLARLIAPTVTEAVNATAANVYLYFDEAGNLDFRPTGSRFFLCGILATHDPWPLTNALVDVRRRIYDGRFIEESFHAAEDKQATRDQVFDCIAQCGRFDYHAVVIEKSTVPSGYQEPAVFYTLVADLILRSTINRYPGARDLFVITDRLPLNRKREAVVKGFKNCLATVAVGRRYQIGHSSAAGHPCLQAADYINWALFRKWERGDLRSYELVRNYVRQEITLEGSLLEKK